MTAVNYMVCFLLMDQAATARCELHASCCFSAQQNNEVLAGDALYSHLCIVHSLQLRLIALYAVIDYLPLYDNSI